MKLSKFLSISFSFFNTTQANKTWRAFTHWLKDHWKSTVCKNSFSHEKHLDNKMRFLSPRRWLSVTSFKLEITPFMNPAFLFIINTFGSGGERVILLLLLLLLSSVSQHIVVLIKGKWKGSIYKYRTIISRIIRLA